MPTPTFPPDRFDDLPADAGRVGAHRAEQPRMRGGFVLLWAVAATVVLIGLGIFGTMIGQGRIVLFPTPEPTVAAPEPDVTPVIDTSFEVQVLNATPEQGLATQVKDAVIAAGWPEDMVIAGGAGSEDFPTTTVYYAFPADRAAALGLAGVIGGAEVEQSDFYQPQDDANTPDDESQKKQLVVVLGLDRVTPAPTDTPAS